MDGDIRKPGICGSLMRLHAEGCTVSRFPQRLPAASSRERETSACPHWGVNTARVRGMAAHVPEWALVCTLVQYG